MTDFNDKIGIDLKYESKMIKCKKHKYSEYSSEDYFFIHEGYSQLCEEMIDRSFKLKVMKSMNMVEKQEGVESDDEEDDDDDGSSLGLDFGNSYDDDEGDDGGLQSEETFQPDNTIIKKISNFPEEVEEEEQEEEDEEDETQETTF